MKGRFARLKAAFSGEALGARMRVARSKYRWLDHLTRTWSCYTARGGDDMAASLTFYSFLSFFPMLALAYALLGYSLHFSDTFQGWLITAMNDYLPGLASRLDVERIAGARVGASVVGLVGLAWTGLGWAGNLRKSIRTLWGLEPKAPGNFFVLRLRDLWVLAFLGVMLICSVAATTFATSLTGRALDFTGIGGIWATLTLRPISIVVALVFNTLIFLVLFTRLSGTKASWRHVFKGALLAAVGFEVLKTLAALLLGMVTSNPVYASFAVLVGALLWINIVCRLIFLAVSWTSTRSVVRRADHPTRSDPDAA
ncbi:YihY/virulence factor BrkB family protein [Actinocorallia sp. A-T 12471]|uniref:YihY/virulence factor BrkB family protein n=1 Tax=Actinocorallia sp. A-T 12471 TaxID=3089813 RepID=UPI0029D218CD|nr:YihY/virulence factor BrkB family protein [Actinocorallia sp. A-T 12471]MDX6744497.1 YihY/virulence factor BrkB family protein [Actinocorallia sp. A-T 12471]